MFPRSKRAEPPATEALEPILETYAGTNNAYRGIEQHGVPFAPSEWPGRPGYGAVNVEWSEAPKPVDAVPVRIVGGEDSSERRSVRLSRSIATAGGIGSRVVGGMASRTKLKVKNTSAEVAYIGHEQSSLTSVGWPLAQNETFETNSQDELWACTAHATNTAELAVMTEYVRG